MEEQEEVILLLRTAAIMLYNCMEDKSVFVPTFITMATEDAWTVYQNQNLAQSQKK